MSKVSSRAARSNSETSGRSNKPSKAGPDAPAARVATGKARRSRDGGDEWKLYLLAATSEFAKLPKEARDNAINHYLPFYDAGTCAQAIMRADKAAAAESIEARSTGAARPTWREALQSIYDAGGKAWDNIQDPAAYIAEMRGGDAGGNANRMFFRVGSHAYGVRIGTTSREDTDLLKDRFGTPADAIMDPEAMEILLAPNVRRDRRRELVQHELWHAWLNHVGKPTDEESQAMLHATAGETFAAELDAQGGIEALKRLEPTAREGGYPEKEEAGPGGEEVYPKAMKLMMEAVGRRTFFYRHAGRPAFTVTVDDALSASSAGRVAMFLAAAPELYRELQEAGKFCIGTIDGSVEFGRVMAALMRATGDVGYVIE